MPTVTLDDKTRTRKMRRALIVGAPNTFKTTSLGTFPRPTFIYSYPGEEGVGSIPTGDGITARAYEMGPNETHRQAWDEILAQTSKVVRGTEYKTFCGDGIYQLASLALDVVSGGNFTKGDKVDPFLYPQATKMMTFYLHLVMDSPIEYAVFTAWEGKEVIDPMANAKSDAPRALYPHLPGALAKEIMGMFSVVLYCEVGQAPGPGKPMPAWWRLKPTQTIRSAGVKLPLEQSLALPERVDMDWAKLEPYLIGTKK